MADRDVVTEVLAGNHDAYAALVDRYQRGLCIHLTRIVHDADTADDLCQEAFIKAFFALKRYDSKYAFSTWLYRIGTNQALDYLRKHRPEAMTELPEVVSEYPEFDVAEQLDRKARAVEVRRFVNALPAKYRSVIRLHYWQHLSYQQVANKQHTSINTTKTRLFRAKKLLEEKLHEQK
jgi:RNA polymerase sigma-70 factor (ECF subfamily)